MPPVLPPAQRAAGTPLAPSVEKAYYRKCIQLKRRLNEVEAANEEARTRRVRLDRAIMKMRLERAFLLEQLSKRVEPNVEGSDASGEEGPGTPPPDRPHRDKRRASQMASPDAERGGLPVPPPSKHATRSSSGVQRRDSNSGNGAVQDGERTRAARPTGERWPSVLYGLHPQARDPYSAGLPYASDTHGEAGQT